MPLFALQRGPTPLMTWDLETGAPTFSRHAKKQQGRLVIGESEPCAFTLSPAVDGREYQLLIGDVPVADLLRHPVDAGGVAMRGERVWRDWRYFESARGETKVLLQSRMGGSETEAWDAVLDFSVCVIPTKLGEASYQMMADDVQALSRSLLVDLYGKSTRTYDVRFAREARRFHSREEELDSIAAVVDRLGFLLTDIQRRPSSRMERQMAWTSYWGSEGLGPRALATLSRQGTSVRGAARPIPIVQARLTESFDIAEHRILKGFLGLLERRAALCARAAAEHIQAIDAERSLRDIRLGSAPSLYESIDVPKINRLTQAIQKATRLRQLIQAMAQLPFLRNITSELAPARGGAFQRSLEYQELLRLIRGFLTANPLWYEGDGFCAVTKLTSRLFEHWCFLRIVDAFRASGLELQEWDEALRQNLQSRFIMDFDRGLQFEGLLTAGLRLRLRYEPWILGEQLAEEEGETLSRASTQTASWCPDVVVECLKLERGAWEPVYAIVLDCKYSLRIEEHHWNDTRKYMQIRSLRSKRQIVRQLWLVWPGANAGITCTDDAVVFDKNGPSCPRDEAVYLTMAARPEPEDSSKESPDAENVFRDFATGTINFFRRELI